MPTVLVTGASGFTGRYMVDALKRQRCRVVGIVNAVGAEEDVRRLAVEPLAGEAFTTSKSFTGADVYFACDLTDAVRLKAVVALAEPDWVIHLAAISFVAHNQPHAFYDINLFGTLNLLQALSELAKPPSRILIASSANIYGMPALDTIHETVCPAPVNHYACSKLAMEHMVATWFERLPIIIVRPFNYTGPGQDSRFLIPKIVEHFASHKRTIELGNTNISRDFSDVRDVVQAYLRLLEKGDTGQIFNVCSGRDISLQAIIKQLGQLAGYQMEVVVNPTFVRANEISRLRGSHEKLTQTTGWQPDISFFSTLRDMLNYDRG